MEISSNDFDYSTDSVYSMKHQYSLLTIFVLIFIILLALFEYLFYLLIYFITGSILLYLLLFIIIHILLLRDVVLRSAFPGKNYLVQLYLLWSQSNTSMFNFQGYMRELNQKLDQLLNMSTTKDLNRTNCEFFIERYSLIKPDLYEIRDSFDKMKEKYGENSLSPCNKIFSEKIYTLIAAIEISKITEILSLTSEEDKIIHFDSSDLEEIKKIMGLIKDLDNFVDKILSTSNNIGIFNLFSSLKFLYQSDLFRDKRFYRSVILLPKNREEFSFMSNNKKIEGILLTSEEKNKNKNLVIVCGPNLTSMEHIIFSWDLKELYLDKGTDACLWNYQGYGFSEGSANFKRICEDVVNLYDYLVREKRWNKIGVHGLSVGGVPACHLAYSRNDVAFLIADRTFGSVKQIARSFPLGFIFDFLSKVICINDCDNAYNYINAKCPKVILNDPYDKTITEKISLKNMVAKIFMQSICEMDLEGGRKSVNKNDGNQDIPSFVKFSEGLENIHLPDFSDKSKDYFSKYSNYSALFLKAFPDDESRNKFISSFKYALNLFNNYTKQKYLLGNKKKSNDDQPEVKDNHIKLSEEEDPDQEENIERQKVNTDKEENLKERIYDNLVQTFEQFNACGDVFMNFSENESNLSDHLMNFMNSFFIFGGRDIQTKYRLTSNKFCPFFFDIMIESNAKILEEYEKDALVSGNKLYTKLKTFIEGMKALKKYFMDINMLKLEDKWLSKIKGNLIPLHCGHISFFHFSELNAIHNLGKDVGFFPKDIKERKSLSFDAGNKKMEFDDEYDIDS
ncbi:MAG: hypothetical protein MJ252_00895 [archaeon]|nr:hypothetical protein [archaeon]